MISEKELNGLLERLVAIKSRYFEEEEIMRFARGWLRERSIPAEIHRYCEKTVTGFSGCNVLALIDGGEPGPAVLLNGHLDTVIPCAGWTKDPFGERDGDRFYGTGALDMKAGCAALMVAAADFARENRSFAGKIMIAFTSVEEGPYSLGLNALIEEGLLEGVNFSIVAEPSAAFAELPYPALCLGARGGFGLSVILRGRSAHAASPERGVSALVDAAKVICEFEKMSYACDPYLGSGVCVAVGIDSDGGACSVPDRAEIKLFRHTVRGEDKESIRRQLGEAIEKADISCDWDIEFRKAPSPGSDGFMPFRTDENDAMVLAFEESVKAVTGKAPAVSYFSSIGDFNYLGTRVDAPVVIFGPEGRNYHSADEYVELPSVYRTAEAVKHFLDKTLKKDFAEGNAK